jgi:hypothetical protein
MTHAAACVARHIAPLIGERAAAHGRSATEGSDARAWGAQQHNANRRFRICISATFCDPRDRLRAKIR